MMVRAEDILEQAARWCADGHMVALATVIETWGSSPRPVGSQLVISNTRQFAGSVSGGCIEGAVVGEAIKVIASGKSTTLKFNVSDEEALNIGLTCGGSVSVLINPVDPDGILKELALNIAKRTPLSIITKLSSGEQSLASAANHPDTLSNELVQSGLDAINSRVSSIKDDAGEQYFIHAFPPAPRIFVVGAGHIAQALCPMANIAGFDVTIIDPRPAFITEQRFPGINPDNLAGVWPDEFFGDHKPDCSTAIVTLVHDPKIDDPALEIAIRSEAFYVGALGSKRTNEKREQRFITNGYTKDELLRIHAPIGLDLGGRKPPEIAVSILAEIVQVWSGKSP